MPEIRATSEADTVCEAAKTSDAPLVSAIAPLPSEAGEATRVVPFESSVPPA